VKITIVLIIKRIKYFLNRFLTFSSNEAWLSEGKIEDDKSGVTASYNLFKICSYLASCILFISSSLFQISSFYTYKTIKLSIKYILCLEDINFFMGLYIFKFTKHNIKQPLTIGNFKMLTVISFKKRLDSDILASTLLSDSALILYLAFFVLSHPPQYLRVCDCISY
jgi:hypothetical protein